MAAKPRIIRRADIATIGWRELVRRYAENGPTWLLYRVLALSSARVNRVFQDKSRELERRKGKPGTNSVRANKAYWSTYDWRGGGDEWSLSPQWRTALVDEFITPNLGDGADILEIGPGAGRWTKALHEHARHLYLVDITAVTLDMCRERLGNDPNVSCLLSDGTSLAGVPDKSVDFVWAFDVFVHIAPADQRRYLAHFRRVMRPGARAVIHHAGQESKHGGWRSHMTADLFRDMIGEAGFCLVRQAETWGPEHEYGLPCSGDVVTIFDA